MCQGRTQERTDQAHTVRRTVVLCLKWLFRVRKPHKWTVRRLVGMNRRCMARTQSVQWCSGTSRVRMPSTGVVRGRIELSRCHMPDMTTDRWLVDTSRPHMGDMSERRTDQRRNRERRLCMHLVVAHRWPCQERMECMMFVRVVAVLFRRDMGRTRFDLSC
jgi:hypothetical protein